jgi:flagellar hook assembly protein FlgD
VQRELTIDIYDLAGRRIRRLERLNVIRGLFDQGPDVPEWDGRDDEGEQVAPGNYIYRISLDTDEEIGNRTGTISLVY